MNSFKTKWHGKKATTKIEDICRAVVKESAEAVAKDARLLVPIDTGGLQKSIHIKVFKKAGVLGAYIKTCEKGKEQVAGFVELGTPGTITRKGKNRTPIKAAPFMRPSLKKNKSKIKKVFENKLK